MKSLKNLVGSANGVSRRTFITKSMMTAAAGIGAASILGSPTLFAKPTSSPHASTSSLSQTRSVRAPNHEFYKKEWDIAIPKNLNQSFAGPDRPAAHLNSIRAVDLQVLSILNELDALGLSDRTVIVFTSRHPDVPGGQDCRALTGHIDIASGLSLCLL